MRFAVVDVETTGLDPAECEVCELGFVILDYCTETGEVEKVAEHQWMMNPGMPIPPNVSAITHIIDEDVEHARHVDGVMIEIAIELDEWGVDAIVAHNADFDKGFCEKHFTPVRKQGESKWICTKRLAQHLWPDSPAHTNQTMRYYLKLEGLERGAPHRALFDAKVTAKLFEKILERDLVSLLGIDAESGAESIVCDFIEFANSPITLKNIHFGKHRGMPYSEVPTSYLNWMVKQDFEPDVLHTAQQEIGNRNAKK